MKSKYLNWAKWLMIFAVAITLFSTLFAILRGIFLESDNYIFFLYAKYFNYIGNFEIVAFYIAILLIILYLQNKEK